MIEQGDSLRQQVLIGHVAHVTGCGVDEARALLARHAWQLEPTLSTWFSPGEHSTSSHISARKLCPTNTPATPPSLMDAMLAMQKLDWRPSIAVERRRMDEELEKNGTSSTAGAVNRPQPSSSSSSS